MTLRLLRTSVMLAYCACGSPHQQPVPSDAGIDSSTDAASSDAGPEAPTRLTYSMNPALYISRLAITPNSPSSSGGSVDSYSLSPALPTGLSLDHSTGVISGTPTSISPTTSYTITATNVGGSTTASVSITVDAEAE